MSTAGVEDWSEWRGKYVTLTLNAVGSSSDSNITGRVFTVSKEWNALVIQSETRVLHQQATFHILQLDKIVNVVEVTDKATSVDEALHVRPVDMNKLRQREATAIKKESQRASKINPNIGREVQLLFNELDRTLPCRWDGPKIVVLEDIEIVSPYTKDNVQMRSGAASARPSTSLGRVKQIVDTYYSRQRK